MGITINSMLFCVVCVLLIGFCGCFAFGCPIQERPQPTMKTKASMGASRIIVSLLRFFLLVGFVMLVAAMVLLLNF
jgi:hypothetical protein